MREAEDIAGQPCDKCYHINQSSILVCCFTAGPVFTAGPMFTVLS